MTKLIKSLPLLFILLGLLIPKENKAQVNIKDSSIRVFLISANYSLEKPGGNLDERFGLSNFLGPAVSFKTQSNWLFTIEHDFLFGNEVKIDPLSIIKGKSDHLINGKGFFEPLTYQERGFRSEIKVGKIFPWFGPNPNSGPFFQLGVGLLQHKINYQTQSQAVYQLKENYIKGYDRLTNGLSITETLGYFNLSDNKLVNFSIAFQMTQAFTKNRRDWNFDTMEKADELRLDLLFGIRAEWSFPIYNQASEGFYYH